MKSTLPSLGTFHWHNTTQFGGALNDNLFKLLVIYGMTRAWPDTAEGTIFGIVAAVFAIPFLLFLGLAGVVADRFPKDNIVRAIKIAETGVMLFGAMALAMNSGGLILAAIFLMSTQSAMFSPTKFGIVPELVGRDNISRANGYMQAATYLAIILGTILAPALSRMLDERYAIVGLFCAIIGFLGWLASRKIQPGHSANQDARASVFFLRDILRTLRVIHRDGFLALAAWSSAYFLMIASFIQLNMLTYGTDHLGMADHLNATYLFLLVAIGIGVGSLAAGKVSRRSIEFGIIPIGSTFLMISCAGLAFLPEGAIATAAALCLLMGFGAGLFIVPVQSFLQFRSPPEKRGEIIAASGWLSWLGVLLAAGLLYLCSEIIGLTPAGSFLFMAALIGILLLASVIALPDFLARFLVMGLTRCFYRLRCNGIEHLPAHGPALIASNHVSLMDPVWLLASQQRRIRFLMSSRQIEHCPWWMRQLIHLARVIPIHSEDNPKTILKALKQARQALDDGYLVAIFPEAHLSRTGHLLPFQSGLERIVKDSDIPIIPIYIEGGYASRAGYGGANPPRLLRPDDFQRQITLSIGPPLPPSTPTREVRNAINRQATTATDDYAPIRGSAGRCFVRNAKKHWRKFAIADSSGKELTYGRALTGALVLRSKLRRELSGDPEEIGVLVPPSAGGALVNLALAMDFRVSINLNYTASEKAIRSAIEQTGMQTLITSRKVIEKFPDIPTPERVLYLEDLAGGVSTPAKLLHLLKARLLPTNLLVCDRLWRPEDPLTILFSSGSTGEPKGVPLSHHNILSNIDGFSVIARHQEHDRLCAVVPFFHSLGYTTTLWFPLTRGIGVMYHHNPLETQTIGDLAGKYKATILIGTPTFLMAWVRKIPPENFQHLRWVVAGAEKLRPKVSDMFEKRFGIRPLEGYGITECSPVISVNVPDVEADGLRQTGGKDGTVGRPLPNLLTRVVHTESGEELPPGESGLLHVKGPSVMHGYLKNPEKTNEVLKDGWYNTGDVVSIDEEGFITITDRLTRFSKLGGEMVSHSAVEEALQKQLGCSPDQLAIAGVPDEKKGEKLIVIFQRDLGDPADLHKSAQKADIPNLWKPGRDAWIPVDQIPVLGTGKLDIRKLKDIANQAGDCTPER